LALTYNALFATIQLALALGPISRRSVKPALLASIFMVRRRAVVRGGSRRGTDPNTELLIGLIAARF
jgi:hypothetical protein